MNLFNRTAIDAEKHSRSSRDSNDVKYCKEEIYSSINHLLISFEKFVDNTTSDDISINKDSIDNVYYHIGKIKGLV